MADESKLESLLLKWETKASEGVYLRAEELCADCPELLDQLRWKIEHLGTLPQAADSEVTEGARVTSSWERGGQTAETRPATEPPGGDQSGAFGILDSERVQDRHETQPCAEVVKIDKSYTTISTNAEFVDVRLFAEGGFGKVCVGQDAQLSRKVAIKFLKSEFLNSSSDFEAFSQEARITSHLGHPGVIPVYNFGISHDGHPFYVMPFVRGRTFEDLIERFHHDSAPEDMNQRAPTFRELLNIFVSVCNTIAYAHSRGVVNRDIKPKNVMLGVYGETFVVDWGSAISLAVDGDSNEYGDSVILPQSSTGSQSQGLTPAYMSPEQARSEPISFATDIYSLGATLYHILTGRTQVGTMALSQTDHDLATASARVAKGLIPTPRRIRKQVPAAMEAICLRAMANEPADRYPTALDLAHDVKNYLGDLPVTAYSENLVERGHRWLRQHRSIFRTGVFSFLLLTLMLAGFTTFLVNQASDLRAARNEALVASEKSLQVAAHFAAKTVGQRVNERFRFLEAAAADRELAGLLEQSLSSAADGVPPASTLQQLESWLRACRDKYSDARADSWFICDEHGRQLARMEPKRKSLLRSFAGRDYFHGQGFDLPDDQISTPPKHITELHRSSIYLSSNTGLPKIALSIPIWRQAGEAKFLGILGMSVALGRFGELHDELSADLRAVLISVNTERIEDREFSPGMTLHHPELGSLLEPGSLDFPVISDRELIRRFQQRRKERRLQLESHAKMRPEEEPTNLIREYRDPLEDDPNANWTAAFEPILIPGGRSRKLSDPGWIVLVQQRADQQAD